MKKVHFKFVLFSIGLFILTIFSISCQKMDKLSANPSILAADTLHLDIEANAAMKAFSDARIEFYDSIPSAMDSIKLPKTVESIIDTMKLPKGVSKEYALKHYVMLPTRGRDEIHPKHDGIKETIAKLGWDAVYTHDDSKLVEYLKEKGLYNKYLRICKKHHLEEHTKNLSLRKKSIDITFFQKSIFTDGDIFCKYDVSSSGSSALIGAIVPGHYTHSAFLDVEKRGNATNNNYLLSASNQTDHGFGVGYDKVQGYWTDAAEVGNVRVNGATDAQRHAAVVYSRQFIGKSYGIVPYNRDGNDLWYCSKLVYRGWMSQGYELEPHYDDFTGIAWISYPKFVGWSNNWIPIPLFQMVDIPDMYVTPQNLYEDHDASVYPAPPSGGGGGSGSGGGHYKYTL